MYEVKWAPPSPRHSTGHADSWGWHQGEQLKDSSHSMIFPSCKVDTVSQTPKIIDLQGKVWHYQRYPRETSIIISETQVLAIRR